MTTRTRFALWAALASSVAVLVAGVVAAARVEASIQGFVDQRLGATLAAALAAKGIDATCAVAAAAVGDSARSISIVDPNGSERCRSRPSAPSPRALGADQASAPAQSTYRTRTVDAVPWRVAQARRPDGRLVVVADAVAASEQAKRDALRAIVLAMVVGSVIATGIGALAAAPATRRIDQLLAGIALAGRDPMRVARVGKIGGRDLDAAASSFDSLLDDLHAANAAQQRLFADTAHELRTPLTSIRTNAQLLERNTNLDGEARDMSARIARQAEGVAHLVVGLVDRAAINAWSQRDDLAVSLGVIAQAAVDRARIRWPDAPMKVEADESVVHADADLVARALGNLIDNAIVHGGGTVRIEVLRGVIAVEDDGAGFSDESTEARAVTAGGTRVAAAGNGLGLAFAEHVAQAHGGKVHIEPSSGPTRVELRLDEENSPQD